MHTWLLHRETQLDRLEQAAFPWQAVHSSSQQPSGSMASMTQTSQVRVPPLRQASSVPVWAGFADHWKSSISTVESRMPSPES
ncbi:MAG: hypothetical protein WKG00_14180 [Polyangiaceae bacterium]